MLKRKYHLILNIFTIFVLLKFGAVFAYAQEIELESEEEIEQAREKKIEESREIKKNLIETNRAFSDWFNSVTNGVDLFLAGEQANKVQAESKVILDNTVYSREGNNFTNLTTISVNPRFPNLEAYWNLKFSTYDDTSINKSTQGGYATQTPQDKNYAATIGLFRKVSNVRLAFQPRIELQNPLKVSHYVSVETILDHGRLKINPKLQLFASATKGTGTFQALNFYHKLNDVFSMTYINEGEYEDRIHRWSVNNGVSLGQQVTDTGALSYGLIFYSQNKPNYHLDAYSFSVTWADEIYKDILYYRIRPHVDFVQNENFRGFFGVVLGLSLIF